MSIHTHPLMLRPCCRSAQVQREVDIGILIRQQATTDRRVKHSWCRITPFDREVDIGIPARGSDLTTSVSWTSASLIPQLTRMDNAGVHSDVAVDSRRGCTITPGTTMSSHCRIAQVASEVDVGIPDPTTHKDAIEAAAQE